MKIYIANTPNPNTQLCLDSARVSQADVVVIKKAEGITAVYPVSDSGEKDLDRLVIRAHYQVEYDASFYPFPFNLHDTLVYLNGKFKLEWVNAPGGARSADEYHIGDLVICPSELGNEILEVSGTRPVQPDGVAMAGHKQFVIAKTTRVSLTSMSGFYFVMVSKK